MKTSAILETLEEMSKKCPGRDECWKICEAYSEVIEALQQDLMLAKQAEMEARQRYERVFHILKEPLLIQDDHGYKRLRPIKNTSRQDVYSTLLKAQMALGVPNRWYPEEWGRVYRSEEKVRRTIENMGD